MLPAPSHAGPERQVTARVRNTIPPFQGLSRAPSFQPRWTVGTREDANEIIRYCSRLARSPAPIRVRFRKHEAPPEIGQSDPVPNRD